MIKKFEIKNKESQKEKKKHFRKPASPLTLQVCTFQGPGVVKLFITS